MLSGLTMEGSGRYRGGLQSEFGERAGELREPLQVGSVQSRLAARELPANHRYRDAGTEDGAGGFRIGPDIELGRGGDVALAARCAPHDDAAPDVRFDAGF